MVSWLIDARRKVAVWRVGEGEESNDACDCEV